MELTLIPLAAILLLLSGASGRVRLAEAPSVSSSLIRLWMVRETAQKATRIGVRIRRVSLPRTAARLERCAYQRAQTGLVWHTRLKVQRLPRALLRGRFDVRSVAFLSTAPPLS